MREPARRRVRARRDVSTHLLLFVIANAFLWTAWAIASSPVFDLAASPIWVTFGWGAIVVLDAWSVHHATITDQDVDREVHRLRRS